MLTLNIVKISLSQVGKTENIYCCERENKHDVFVVPFIKKRNLALTILLRKRRCVTTM